MMRRSSSSRLYRQAVTFCVHAVTSSTGGICSAAQSRRRCIVLWRFNLNRFIRLGSAILVLLSALVVQAEPLMLEFEPARSAETAKLRTNIIKSERFQIIVRDLNQELVLPKGLTVRFTDTDDEAPFYDPDEQEIVFDYSVMLDDLELMGGDRQFELMLDVSEFFFYHEVGHALIDSLEIPVAGREEDAVDGLAAYVILELMDEPEVAMHAAHQFLEYWETYESDESDFYGEHSLDKQRFYNLVGWVYGSDPDRFETVVEELVPDDWWEDRADSCEEEYEQLRDSWEILLSDQLK